MEAGARGRPLESATKHVAEDSRRGNEHALIPRQIKEVVIVRVREWNHKPVIHKGVPLMENGASGRPLESATKRVAQDPRQGNEHARIPRQLMVAVNVRVSECKGLEWNHRPVIRKDVPLMVDGMPGRPLACVAKPVGEVFSQDQERVQGLHQLMTEDFAMVTVQGLAHVIHRSVL